MATVYARVAEIAAFSSGYRNLAGGTQCVKDASTQRGRKMKFAGNKGFMLIELLIVVTILGILAAVVMPNVGRFLGRGEAEARRAESHNINTAVLGLMVENSLTKIPNPVGTPPCTGAITDMKAFPDSTSVATSADKKTDPSNVDYLAGDKDGYILFGHDLTADNSTATLVNYINFDKTTYFYTAEANGTVHQCDAAGGTEYTN